MTDVTWLDIATVPRDGRAVELRNSFGLMPTYGLYRWVDGRGWLEALDERRGILDGPHLSWRPYDGDPSAYVDPTDGAQHTSGYWAGATVLHDVVIDNSRSQGSWYASSPQPPAARSPGPGDIAFVDLSAQVFGKYQHCTQNKDDGLFYADSDFERGRGCGKLKPGSLPNPRQSSPEATARAKAMHESSALAAADAALAAAAPAAAVSRGRLPARSWFRPWRGRRP